MKTHEHPIFDGGVGPFEVIPNPYPDGNLWALKRGRHIITFQDVSATKADIEALGKSLIALENLSITLSSQLAEAEGRGFN